MNLWKKFKLEEKKSDYKTVYYGFDFTMGCTKVAQISAEIYGHGGTMYINRKGMEIAVKQWGEIVLYIGPADNSDESFTGIVKKDN